MFKVFILFYLLLSNYTVFWQDDIQNPAVSSFNLVRGILMSDLVINFLFALIVIIWTVIVSKKVRWILEKYLVVDAVDSDDTSKEEVFWVISRTVNIWVWVIGLSFAMGVMWLDMALFMWWIWFWIWFTMQTFLSNFISWVIIVLQWTFKTGDIIDMWWKVWIIKKINTLFTEAEEFDGVKYYIPNIKFLQEDVSNFTANEKRRFDIDLNLDKETDIVKAKKIIDNVLASFPNVLRDPEPQIWITNLEEWAVKIKILFWLSSKDKVFIVRSNIVETINLAFKQAWIIVPFKQVMVSNRD